MPPSAFSLRLQHGNLKSFIRLFFITNHRTTGITGGFAPPTPSAVYTLDRAESQTLVAVSAATRADGTPTLSAGLPKSLSFSDADAGAQKLVDELHGILKTLPTESPPGSEDIYGEDTGIVWLSDDLEWMNGGPAGCGGGVSDVHPTAEEKQKFKRAVQIVNQLVGDAK